MYVSNQFMIDSGNGLLPDMCQANTQTSADIFSVRPQATNFSEIWIRIQTTLRHI